MAPNAALFVKARQVEHDHFSQEDDKNASHLESGYIMENIGTTRGDFLKTKIRLSAYTESSGRSLDLHLLKYSRLAGCLLEDSDQPP